jgi:hypothetical protein
MKTERTSKRVTVVFDSAHEFLDYVSSSLTSSYAATRECGDFVSTTYAEALELFRSGWSDGVKELDTIKAEIQRRLDTCDVLAYDIDYQVIGDFIDMGRVLTGEPECFGSINLTPQPKESVTVQISANYLSSVTQAQVFNRGAAICALVESLRQKYHVYLEFVCLSSYISTPKRGAVDCNIVIRTDTTNEFSRDMLAFCMANAGFFRRLVFVAMENALNYPELGGYGTTSDLPESERKGLYIPALKSHERCWNSVESATEKIKSILREYNQTKVE